MRHSHPARALAVLIGVFLLFDPLLSWAQRGRRAAAPDYLPHSYLEVALQGRRFATPQQRDTGDGRILRLSYQSSANMYFFYEDGELDYDLVGRASTTAYGLGLVYGVGQFGSMSFELERARSEDPAGRLPVARASGTGYRLAYQTPLSPMSALEIGYRRDEYSAENSNRYELGWIYRADPRWTLGARISEDTDSDSDRSATRLLMRYHY